MKPTVKEFPIATIDNRTGFNKMTFKELANPNESKYETFTFKNGVQVLVSNFPLPCFESNWDEADALLTELGRDEFVKKDNLQLWVQPNKGNTRFIAILIDDSNI